MGHREAAREILIEKERLQRKKAQGVSPLAWRAFCDEIYRATVRYGYAPLRTLWLIGAIILPGWAVFDQASEADAILPNNAFVLRAPEWVLCGMPASSRIFLPSQQKIASGRARSGESQRDCFERQPEALSFLRFNPVVYSTDTHVPFVDLQQEVYGIPEQGGYRWYLWFQIGGGWILSLLFISGVTGLVRAD